MKYNLYDILTGTRGPVDVDTFLVEDENGNNYEFENGIHVNGVWEEYENREVIGYKEFNEWFRSLEITGGIDELCFWDLVTHYIENVQGEIHMEKHDYTDVLGVLAVKGMEKAQQLNIDTQVDEFTIVQPLENGHAVTLSVTDTEESGRTVSIEVSETVICLEPMKGQLDIFAGDDDEEVLTDEN